MGLFNSSHQHRSILLASLSLILMIHVNCSEGLDVLFLKKKSVDLFSEWSGSITITIDSAKVASDLTNFPVLISFPNNASLMGNAKPDGSDIFFEDETNTKLDHEIEKYDNSTGELIAWVRVPFLLNSTDTDIHLYYGNPSSPDQSNKTGVWDANYLTVLHMNNDPTAAGGNEIQDSSMKFNHFTNPYGLTSGDSVNAYIGKGLNMVEKGIERSDLLGQPANVTISAWINFTGVLPGKNGGEIVDIGNIFGVRIADSNTGRDGFFWYTSGGYHGLMIVPPNPLPAPQSICSGTGWHYIVATFDDTGKTQKIYIDGILKETSTFPDSVVYVDVYVGSGPTSSPTSIGKHPDNNSYDYNGEIDETRISDIPRSEEWIQTEYNNQSSPSTFYSVW